MRNQDTLRDAFDLLADHAPVAPEQSRARPEPLGRRRSLAVVGAVVVAVVAIVIGVGMAGRRPSPQPAAAPFHGAHYTHPIVGPNLIPDWDQCYGLPTLAGRFGLRLDARPAWSRSRYGEFMCSGMSEIDLLDAGRNDDAEQQVVLYQPGAFDPSSARKGRPTTFRGHRAYHFTDYRTAFSALPFGLLLWQYQPHAWAEVIGTGPVASLAALRRTASRIRVDAAARLPVSYQLGYVPAGWGLSGVVGDVQAPQPNPARDLLGTSSVFARSGSANRTLTVNALARTGSYRLPAGSFRIDGHPAAFDHQGSRLTVVYPAWVVTFHAPDQVSDAELVRMAEQLVPVTSSTSEQDWPDVTRLLR